MLLLLCLLLIVVLHRFEFFLRKLYDNLFSNHFKSNKKKFLIKKIEMIMIITDDVFLKISKLVNFRILLKKSFEKLISFVRLEKRGTKIPIEKISNNIFSVCII